MDPYVAYDFVFGGVMDGVVARTDCLGEGLCVWDRCWLGMEVD